MNKYLKKLLHIGIFLIVIVVAGYSIFNIFFYVKKYYVEKNIIEIELEVTENKDDINVEDILDLLNESIDNEFKNTINYLNFTLVGFSTALALFFVLVGFISYSKIKDINKLMEELQKSPDKIVNSFYDKQIHSMMNDMLDLNIQKRGEAIKLLNMNPNVGVNQYNIIWQCFRDEYNAYGTNILYNNINTLLLLLSKIDDKKTIKKVIGLFDESVKDKSKAPTKIYSLIMYLSSFNDVEVTHRVEKYLEEKKDNIGMMLLTYVLMNHTFKDEYLSVIFKENNTILQTTFIGSIFTYYPDYDGKKIIENVMNNKIEQQIINMIFMNENIKCKIEDENLFDLLFEFTKENKNNIGVTYQAHQAFISKIIDKPKMLKDYKKKIEEIDLTSKIETYLINSNQEYKEKIEGIDE